LLSAKVGIFVTYSNANAIEPFIKYFLVTLNAKNDNNNKRPEYNKGRPTKSQHH